MTLAWIQAEITNALILAVAFIFVISVLVVVHELGHFLVARALGITVERFSLGFGREIAGFTDKKGTRWRVAWIPLGGYVKFKGDETVASMPSREELENLSPEEKIGNFHTAPLWRRTLVVLAGPVANFILAIVIYTGMFWIVGGAETDTRIVTVQQNMPAEKAGLLANDKIVSVNGERITNTGLVQKQILLNAHREITVQVERAGQILDVKIVPAKAEDTCMGRIGVELAADNSRPISYGGARAFVRSLDEIKQNILTPFQFLSQLARGNACAKQLSGPVKIADMSRQIASDNPLGLIPFIAFLSVGIGLFNLFPIPVLDGGHLLFYGAEAIVGKPMSKKVHEIGFGIGFVFLIMLMLFVTVNNVMDIL